MVSAGLFGGRKVGPRPRLCLAASGGGHLRQLLDLEPAWAPFEHFFLTEETALGRSLAERTPTHFVDHVALGQGRLGAPWRMIVSAVRNLFQSAAIIVRERPDFVITTGAGSVFFAVLCARLTGARIVVIESFARFESLSVFAKVAGPLAHHKIVQSAALLAHWPKAAVFDPMRILETPGPPKRALLFATVGATLPFDRLVDSVRSLKESGRISEDIIIQTGVGGMAPAGMETYETLPFDRTLAILRDADIVVCHGGTGSLITALREGCRVIALPRVFERGEHYDNHQREITHAFAARGMIAVANSIEELAEALETVRAREPVVASSEPTGLIAHLRGLIADWMGKAVRSERASSTPLARR